MYPQLNAACECVEATLTQLIRDRKTTASEHAQQCPSRSSHLWVQQLNSAIFEYAEVTNMAIVTRIMALPRELRDSIYTHLWEPSGERDPRRDLLYWWEYFDVPWSIKAIMPSSPDWTGSLADLRPPHFVDQRFVGRGFASEVLKRFKDAVGKDLTLNEDRNPIAEFALIDAYMEAFVNKDVFGLGLTVEELVRNLDLRINFQCDALHDDDDVAENEDTRSHLESLPGKNLAELERGVSALTTISYSERMTLNVGGTKRLEARPRIVTLVIRHESSVHSKDSSLIPILKLVHRACTGLRKNDFTVKVQYRSEEIGMMFLFEDDAWLWNDKDWKTNLEGKNLSKVEAEEWFPEKQASIWKDIKEFLFSATKGGESRLRN